MLPNHAPLVIAEQFGTLESPFPGRIDLGLGRAPGTDPTTTDALRRHVREDADDFPRQLDELLGYFRPAAPRQRVRAVPGAGLDVPVWILGSSLFGAQVAAERGLPFGFASHFAPAHLLDALDIYRARFRPSAMCARPYVMLGVNVVAADSHQEAHRLFSSIQQAILNHRHGRPGPLPPPVDGFERSLSAADRLLLDHVLAISFVGPPPAIRAGLDELLARTEADELIVVSSVFDHEARRHSYELTAGVRDALGAAAADPTPAS
jgi:luciferase family oxidoreductase group 1